METTGINRLIMHHTGGTHMPNGYDLKAYHGVTDKFGKRHAGKFPISANKAGTKLVSGRYAAHCKNLNSGSAGEAVACMADGKWSKPYEAKWFPTEQQMDGFVVNVAQSVLLYKIPVARRHLLTHAEVEITLNVDQNDKWDFDYNPFTFGFESRDPIVIGDIFRTKVEHALKRAERVIDANIKNIEIPAIIDVPFQSHSYGSKGPEVRVIQQQINKAGKPNKPLDIDGAFGPLTHKEVRRFQSQRNLFVDGIVSSMTWLNLFDHNITAMNTAFDLCNAGG